MNQSFMFALFAQTTCSGDWPTWSPKCKVYQTLILNRLVWHVLIWATFGFYDVWISSNSCWGKAFVDLCECRAFFDVIMFLNLDTQPFCGCIVCFDMSCLGGRLRHWIWYSSCCTADRLGGRYSRNFGWVLNCVSAKPEQRAFGIGSSNWTRIFLDRYLRTYVKWTNLAVCYGRPCKPER